MSEMTDASGQMPRRPRVGDGGAPVTGALAIVLALVAVVAGAAVVLGWFDADPEWKPIETIRLIMLSGGRMVGDGAPADVLSEKRVQQVFGERVTVVSHGPNGRRYVVPLDDGGGLPAAR